MRRLPPCWTRQRRRCGRSGHNVPVQPAAPLRPVPRFPAPFSVVTCNSVQICANSVSIAQGCAELHIFAFSWMAGWALLANNAGLLACGSARGGARNGTPCGAPAAQDGVLVACGWLSVPGRHGEAVRRRGSAAKAGREGPGRVRVPLHWPVRSRTLPSVGSDKRRSWKQKGRPPRGAPGHRIDKPGGGEMPLSWRRTIPLCTPLWAWWHLRLIKKARLAGRTSFLSTPHQATIPTAAS
jgi:hypothetical protein